MTAWTQDIYIEQGASFPMGFVLHEAVLDVNGEIVRDEDGNPVEGPAKDLTGYTARMQIRKNKKAEVLIEATSLPLGDADPTVVSNGRILLQAGSVTGRVDILLTDLDTEKMTYTKGVYDIEIVRPLQPGELRPFTERVMQGTVTCDLNVTRELEMVAP